ncbi:PREDICTED: ribonuclease P protein subunit p25-like protein [Vollenhovia emeryi]|uniref:ribonuclease P protein subunit p25-like protein n=1 Tax=Vollenhovia emeryi TaxID=411798 RepID=UPI0005F464B8|nr:PREDICTED: ribonuclease P protein subunit p25-like protein [Vollenhovia emeryi]
MEKSKLKKLQQEQPTARETEESTKVPIHNLPERFLWMHVKSGTKIRNVLNVALKEFPNYNSVVWTGIGHGITKVITCAEIFKRKHEGLHQVTKLCYDSSENSKENVAAENRTPKIHILLTKDIKDPTELGYQAPGDRGKFSKKEKATGSKTNITEESTDNVPCIDRQSSTLRKNGKREKKMSEKKPASKKNKAA